MRQVSLVAGLPVWVPMHSIGLVGSLGSMRRHAQPCLSALELQQLSTPLEIMQEVPWKPNVENEGFWALQYVACCEGAIDGLSEGKALGTSDGDSLGMPEGPSEGDWLGTLEGDSLGAFEGPSEGDSLGAFEGPSEGALLGLLDGLSEGAEEGTVLIWGTHVPLPTSTQIMVPLPMSRHAQPSSMGFPVYPQHCSSR